nr:hypothetical protein [Tanacetum cinerariifolium]
LGDEGPSSEGTKLNSTFIIVKVTFTKHEQPTTFRHAADTSRSEPVFEVPPSARCP